MANSANAVLTKKISGQEYDLKIRVDSNRVFMPNSNTLDEHFTEYMKSNETITLINNTNTFVNEVKNDLSNSIAGLNDSLGNNVTLLNSKISAVETIAKGASRAIAFQTYEAMGQWLSNPDNLTKLQIGDNLLIVQKDVPDYWWDGSQIQELETGKVDLSNYYIKEDIDHFFNNTNNMMMTEVNALQNNIWLHIDNNSNPHNVTKKQVGLGSVIDGAQINVIEKIQRNGTDLLITNKTVNITVPTIASDINAEAAQTSVTQAEAEAGTVTAIRSWTPQRVAQAIAKLSLSSADVDTRIQNVIGSAPVALDTLQELANALNNDPDFAATVTMALTLKEDKTNKGIANGYAPLGSDGKIPDEYLPDIQVTPPQEIQDATLTQKGVVKLENSVTSTSSTTAAVPASVKTAYDKAVEAKTSVDNLKGKPITWNMLKYGLDYKG